CLLKFWKSSQKASNTISMPFLSRKPLSYKGFRDICLPSNCRRRDIQQAVNRTFGYKQSDWKDKTKEALKEHNLDEFTLNLDTYESTLETEKAIKKVNEFRTY